MKLKLVNYSLPLMAGMATLVTAVNPVRAANNKPNIVYIVADDLGWSDVGWRYLKYDYTSGGFTNKTEVNGPFIDKGINF